MANRKAAKADESVSTKQRILDAAEALFAERGFDGVSLRQITRAADVELALANYHFGPKTELFLAVVRRRADELNDARMARLSSLPAPASLETLIDAFARPFLDKSVRGGPGWKCYARLIAQTANSARWTESVMAAQFDTVAHEFLQRIRTCLPGLERIDLYCGFQFALGAMTMTFAETGRINRLSNNECRAEDLDLLYSRMLPFLAAGFRALAL